MVSYTSDQGKIAHVHHFYTHLGVICLDYIVVSGEIERAVTVFRSRALQKSGICWRGQEYQKLILHHLWALLFEIYPKYTPLCCPQDVSGHR